MAKATDQTTSQLSRRLVLGGAASAAVTAAPIAAGLLPAAEAAALSDPIIELGRRLADAMAAAEAEEARIEAIHDALPEWVRTLPRPDPSLPEFAHPIFAGRPTMDRYTLQAANKALEQLVPPCFPNRSNAYDAEKEASARRMAWWEGELARQDEAMEAAGYTEEVRDADRPYWAVVIDLQNEMKATPALSVAGFLIKIRVLARVDGGPLLDQLLIDAERLFGSAVS